MKTKHYIAIILPYLVAGLAGVAALASKSPDAKVALAGGAILALLGMSHANVYLTPPNKNETRGDLQ